MMNDTAYSGIENLEIMEQARWYNAFLLSEIVNAAPAGGMVMDFGSGSGTFASRLATRGWQLVCVEPDQHLRDQLRDRGLRSISDLSAVALETIRFIYSLNVFEHIDDDEKTLRELYAALETRGVLFLYVPAFPVLFSTMDRHVGHLRRYRRNELLAMLRRCGFSIRSAQYADSVGFFATLLYKMIGNRYGKIEQRAVVLYDRVLFPISRVMDVICQHFFGKNLMVIAVKE